jgi:hypothetical protein
MIAREELLSRLEYLDSAKDLPALIDQGIAVDSHNGVANLLRKGLGIVAFNILEDFIKKRTGEALQKISSTRIPFANLTTTMQDAAIYDALNSLAFRAKLEKKDGGDWRALIQEEALKIHSTSQGVFELSNLSFVSSGSNVTSAEVANVLSAFGISGGWSTMKTVSDAIGGGLPDLSQAYKNAAERRHACAHVANYKYNYLWLESIKSEILAIASALDILLEARCRQVAAQLVSPIGSHQILEALNYRFLESKDGVFKEKKQLLGRSKRNWTTLEAAVADIRPRLVSGNEFLVILDDNKRICNWYV